jgi:hypothetical protein
MAAVVPDVGDLQDRRTYRRFDLTGVERLGDRELERQLVGIVERLNQVRPHRSAI